MVNLYLVPTPIGNVLDMTYRAVEVLNSVDIIYCEDTRNTSLLLNHYNIKTKLKSYHIFNEEERVLEIISNLKDGMIVALVSDAGYPGISDPGYFVCKKAIEEGFIVSTIPGATASLTALVTSGISCEKFMFYGFLHHTLSQKEKELESLKDFDKTMIFYESPHRIKETIEVMAKIFKDRNICIARELTKKYEEYIRFNLSEYKNYNFDLKGEIVIIVEGCKKDSLNLILNDLTIEEHYKYYVNNGYNHMDAMKNVAKDRNTSKSIIYKELNKEK